MVDLHGLAHFKFDLRPLKILGVSDAGLDVRDLIVRCRIRLVTAHKSNGAGGVLDEIHRFGNDLVIVIPQVHMDEDVPGEQFLHRDFFLTPTNVHHLFLGDKHLLDVRAHLLHINALVNAVEYLLLLPGEGVNNVPSVCHALLESQA